jgi:serine/threonine protein kinase
MTGKIIDEADVFNVARKIEHADARSEYLRQVCGADEGLHQRVAQLLCSFDEQPSFLVSPPTGVGATIDVPAITEKPGTQIGPYKLREQIGEGGFGVVYVAEQTEPVRRKVALKIIKPGMDTREVIARLEAERQALAMMDHPNIAKVLDGGTTSEVRDQKGRRSAIVSDL